jgi:hypothetical protein
LTGRKILEVDELAATPARLDELLEASFERLEDAPATASLPIFGGNERWQVWRRRGEAAG